MSKDLVCGMEVDEKTSKLKSKYKDKTYYFCSSACKLKFDKSPERYVR
ncbi:MAG: YHS domain-containing protein [Nitrososphaeria archaeon]|jgi:Cu+-exporting ATPase